MPIRVLSLDFDGCLFHKAYVVDTTSSKKVVHHNQTFLEDIKVGNKSYAKVITFVGSNRQSKQIDDCNTYSSGYGHYKGSCFPAIQEVSVHLQATLDTFLLADIYGDLGDGTSYARAIDGNHTGEHADWLFDETKATILYAQIHKTALAYSNEQIVFDFFDDRTDILDSLRIFFETYPNLMPANVNLRLNGYDGTENSPCVSVEIQGTGFIDSNYRQTVKDMARITMEQMNVAGQDPANFSINTADHVTPALLIQRVSFVQEALLAAPPVEIAQEPKKVIRAVINNTSLDQIRLTRRQLHFNSQLAIIRDKSDELLKSGHNKDALTAYDLWLKLSSGSAAYFNGSMDETAFRAICSEAMAAARPALEKHRGWKEVLGNLALAIVSLGIGYVVVGLIRQAVTGNFLLFRPKTDSANKLDHLQTSIDLVAPAA